MSSFERGSLRNSFIEVELQFIHAYILNNQNCIFFKETLNGSWPHPAINVDLHKIWR